MVIMARILLPSDYGMIGMLAIFIAIAQTLIDSGFSNALIQKKDRSEIDYSTVFYFNIAVGIVLYFILFFSSPLIARFYNTPELTGLTRVLALNLFINSLAVVQRAILSIKIDFKTQAKASFSAAIISGIVGIYRFRSMVTCCSDCFKCFREYSFIMDFFKVDSFESFFF